MPTALEQQVGQVGWLFARGLFKWKMGVEEVEASF